MISNKEEAKYNEHFIKYFKPRNIEENNNNRLLIEVLERIDNGEIELKKCWHISPRKYQKVIEEYKKNPNFITDFINSIASVEMKIPFNSYRRLFLKLANLTPIKTREIVNLKNSDFLTDGDYCLVKNKYLLFIPLFVEAKAVPKDDRLFIESMVIRGLKNDTEINRRQLVMVFNGRAFKKMGYFGYDKAQMRLHFFLYLSGLGLHDLARAITLMKMGSCLKKGLGFIR